jgi:hypothetical protein
VVGTARKSGTHRFAYQRARAIAAGDMDCFECLVAAVGMPKLRDDPFTVSV